MCVCFLTRHCEHTLPSAFNKTQEPHVSKAPEQTLAQICPEEAGQVVLRSSALAGSGRDLEGWSRGMENIKIQVLSMSSPEHVWPRCLNLC